MKKSFLIQSAFAALRPTFFQLCIIALLIPLSSSAQYTKLNRDIEIDTLYISMDFESNFDLQLQKELLIQFDTLVSIFNKNKNSFHIKMDSTQNINSINFSMDSIKYVDLKKNLWVSGMDLALIGANILIMPYFPPVIPFYLMPATTSRVHIESSPGLFLKAPKLNINSNGFWMKKEKQKLKFKRKFNKVFYRFFQKLSKQNAKNKKR